MAIALVRAATAVPIAQARPASELEKRAAFESLASDEASLRRSAADEFPADQWSQDDAFHNSEYKRAKAIAELSRIRISDVLLAVDDGMHHEWPAPRGAKLQPTVPPCRPRPIH